MKKLTTRTRETRKNGDCLVYLCYGIKRYFSGVTCKSTEFDAATGRIVSDDPQTSLKNAKLEVMRNKLEMEIIYRKIEESEFIDLCETLFEPEKKAKKEEKKKRTYLSYHEEYIGRLTKKNTIITYQFTQKLVTEFDPNCTFQTMTAKWMESFDAWMRGRGQNTNGIAFHMRNIRAVFNYNQDDAAAGLYPFRKYKIKKEATRKRSLDVEQVRELRTCKCEPYQERYRDMFMLMLYFMGINSADLFAMTHDNVQNGRLVYKRSKTGAPFSIKIEPEAQAILDKYRGKEKLLNVVEGCQPATFIQHMQRELQKIGIPKRKNGEPARTKEQEDAMRLFPDLTPYWSRHTWATLAAELDIPKETIGKALGHSWANVTDTYIRFDEKKVDQANRAVIDFINGMKSPNQLEEENRRLQEKIDELLESNRKLQEQLMDLLPKKTLHVVG